MYKSSVFTRFGLINWAYYPSRICIKYKKNRYIVPFSMFKTISSKLETVYMFHGGAWNYQHRAFCFNSINMCIMALHRRHEYRASKVRVKFN